MTTCGVTGLAADTTCTGAAGAACAIWRCCAIASGLPGFLAIAERRCCTGAGAGGGVVLATIGRLTTAAGGRGALAAGACPNTAETCGATRGAAATVLIAVSWLG